MSKLSIFLLLATMVYGRAFAADLRSGNNQSTRVSKAFKSCLVTNLSVGRIKLGMTLGEAMQTYPEANFKRTRDGEGLQLVAVMIRKEELMRLFADEMNEAIDKSKKIELIETFSPKCSTAEGVFPGLLISETEKILGRTKQITLSEIEARQYIEFHNQPPGIEFRIDYTGIFSAAARTTSRYEKAAKIFSLSILMRH